MFFLNSYSLKVSEFSCYSTADYRRELENMSINRVHASIPLSPVSQEAPPPPLLSSTPEAGTSAISQSSFLSAATATGYKLFRTSATNLPDPDQEDVIWHEPEAYSAVITRKDHPRDPTSLLSLREVLRQRPPNITDMAMLSGSKFGSLGSLKSSRLFGNNSGKGTGTNTPPSAWAKPEVQVIKQAAPGEVVSGLPGESTDKLLHDLEPLIGDGETTPTASRPSSVAWTYAWSGVEGEESQIKFSRSGKLGSSSSSNSGSSEARSDATIGPEMPTSDTDAKEEISSKDGAAPAVPPKDEVPDSVQSPSRSHFSTLTSGLSNAMRYVYNPVGDLISRPTSAASSTHHGLLSAEIPPSALENDLVIAERPHVKYDWTIGKRLKFSCTVYYAKEFHLLRRRCGVEDIYLKSLSRSTNWSADGGKSKSNFWKTKDDRFIIKTLVNAWNVADL